MCCPMLPMTLPRNKISNNWIPFESRSGNGQWPCLQSNSHPGSGQSVLTVLCNQTAQIYLMNVQDARFWLQICICVLFCDAFQKINEELCVLFICDSLLHPAAREKRQNASVILARCGLFSGDRVGQPGDHVIKSLTKAVIWLTLERNWRRQVQPLNFLNQLQLDSGNHWILDLNQLNLPSSFARTVMSVEEKTAQTGRAALHHLRAVLWDTCSCFRPCECIAVYYTTICCACSCELYGTAL